MRLGKMDPPSLAEKFDTDLSLIVGLGDLTDAHRQDPEIPKGLPVSIVAVHHPQLCELMLVIDYGHSFGRAAAVLNFHRLPTLAVAACS